MWLPVCVLCVGLVSHHVSVHEPVRLNCPKCLCWFLVAPSPAMIRVGSSDRHGVEAEDRRGRRGREGGLHIFPRGVGQKIAQEKKTTAKHINSTHILCSFVQCLSYVFIHSDKYNSLWFLHVACSLVI